MHTSASAVGPQRQGSAETGALAGMAGATVGALGAVDLLLGIAMLVAAPAFEGSSLGAAASAAMRAYGVRAILAGGLNLGVVWALFSEPGARAGWLFVPLGIAALDIVADLAALSAGAMPQQMLAGTTALHWIFAAGVAAVAVSAWQRQRAAESSGRKAP